MTDTTLAPVAGNERIGELDIIRGFALFGVLWMNMYGYHEYLIPADRLVHLWGEPVDKYVGLFTDWVISGKAQCLFSLLFGFGFAILSARADARGADSRAIYLRRILILLGVGVAHLWLLWAGDILHAYALMGLVLLFTRRWPARWLLGLGLVLALGAMPAMNSWVVLTATPGQPPAIVAMMTAGMERRWDVFIGADYVAYVRELLIMSGPELYFTVIGPAFLGTILGRFFLGAWLFRQGWLQDTARYGAGFRRALPWLLIGGLALAGIRPLIVLLELRLLPEGRIAAAVAVQAGQLVLALGYACALVVLCQSDRWKGRLSGLGAVGQMALTNYLVQSVFYMVVLNGFGLGWMRYAGPVFCLGMAIAVFAVQIAFSLWWLQRYRFGPAEWLWRSVTYRRWQPLRRVRVAAEATTVS